MLLFPALRLPQSVGKTVLRQPRSLIKKLASQKATKITAAKENIPK